MNVGTLSPAYKTPPSTGRLRGALVSVIHSDTVKTLEDGWHKYGDLYHTQMGPYSYIMLSHPDYAHEVLINQRNTFKRPNHVNGGTMLTYIVGLSLLTTDGESWLSKRRMMQPIFHHKRIAEMGNDMAAAGAAMLRRWQNYEGKQLDLALEMKRVTLDIINRTMFGADVLPEFDRIGGTVDESVEFVGRRLRNPLAPPLNWPTPGNRRFLAARNLLDEYLYGIIAKRRASQEHPGDLLDMLLQAQDAETGEHMSDEQVKNEVATIYGAGHETTAIALTWTWHLLHQNPSALAHLRAELEQVLGNRPVTPADLPNLPYTLAVFEESMRLLPPAPFTVRMAYAPAQIDGYAIKQGEIIGISIYNIHRHPQFWPDAAAFKPERFLPEHKATLNRNAYMPFLTGGHMCIGNHFALMEGQLLLAMMAQSYEVIASPEHVVERQIAVTMRPKNGLMVTLKPRK